MTKSQARELLGEILKPINALSPTPSAQCTFGEFID
jgi:hypothetical protein